jgi:fructuronate reductase
MPSGLTAESYIEELFSRWSNTALGDKSARVGSDGSTKLPQRITIPALVAMKKGQEPRLLAITVAAWLMCIAPFKDFAPGEIAAAMKDPAKEKLIALTAGTEDIHGYVQIFFNESEIFSTELSSSHIFTILVENYVEIIYSDGIEEAICKAIE